jgi:hypothetical protein
VQLLLKGTFWLGASTVLYAYLLYPVLIWALAGMRREDDTYRKQTVGGVVLS